MTTVSVMQPYLFPYIGYWQMVHCVDTFVLYDDVNYIKQGWINRNRILVNNEAKFLTLQLFHASPFKRIQEIEILDDAKNRKSLLGSIQAAYRKAPYFKQVYPLLEQIIQFPSTNLGDFLYNHFVSLCAFLGISTHLLRSSKLEYDRSLKGEERLLGLLEKFGTTKYVNSIGGTALYSKEHFKNQGIELQFIEATAPAYKQFTDDYISHLSIIDVLMFNHYSNVCDMLHCYRLV